MSQMIPMETMDALRAQVDLAVKINGIDVALFVPKNLDSVDMGSIFDSNVSRLEYREFKTRVFIEWGPSKNRLRKLGLFTEGDAPILAWFAHNPDVTIGSYIKVDVKYVPRQHGVDEFEIVDTVVKGMADADVVSAFKLAPRRRPKGTQ